MKIIATLALMLTTATAYGQDQFNLWSFESVLPSAAENSPKEPVPPGLSLIKLVELSASHNKNTTTINLMIDNQKVIAGVYNLPDPNNIKEDEMQSRNVYPLAEIESKNGSVMRVQKGRDVLIMQGTLDKQSQEGRFTLKYLKNGLFMSYDSCEFLLKKKADSWYVENAYTGEPVTHIKAITHALGITTLEGLCPAE